MKNIKEIIKEILNQLDNNEDFELVSPIEFDLVQDKNRIKFTIDKK